MQVYVHVYDVGDRYRCWIALQLLMQHRDGPAGGDMSLMLGCYLRCDVMMSMLDRCVMRRSDSALFSLLSLILPDSICLACA